MILPKGLLGGFLAAFLFAPPAWATFATSSAVVETQFSSATTDHNVTLPGTITAGQLLQIDIAIQQSAATFKTPDGWYRVWQATSTTFVRGATFIKYADGDEDGTTVNFITSSAQTGAAQSRAWSDWGAIEAGTAVTGSTTTPDPPSLSPSWGSADTAWVAVTMCSDDDETVSAYPASYSNGVDTISGGGTDSGATVATATRENATATEDPGTFTITDSESCVVNTLGIRPAVTPTDYYVSNAGSGSTCSMGSPCDEIADVELLSLNPGDTVHFNCGDTFGDETWQTQQSGSIGIPINFDRGGATSCTGSNDPIIGGASFSTVLTITHSFLNYENLVFTGTTGVAGANTIEFSNGTEIAFITMDDVVINASEGASPNGASAMHFSNTTCDPDPCVTESIFTDLEIYNGTNGGVNIFHGVDNLVFNNLTIQQPDAIGAQNDLFTTYTNNVDLEMDITINGCLMDRDSDDANADFSMDILAGQIVANDCDFGDTGSFIIHCANPGGLSNNPTTCEFNDSTFHNAFHGWGFIRDTATLTVNRSRFYQGTATDSLFDMSSFNDSGDAAVFTANASTFEIESGSSAQELIEVFKGATFNLNNSTIISRNSASNIRVIQGRSDHTGTISVKNSVIDADGAVLLETDSASTTWTLDQNLYERSDAGDWVDDNGTTYSEATLISTFDTSGSTTGDPLFTTENETNGNYLMLSDGSPGLDLGDPANLYDGPGSLDVFGFPYDASTPNAGARASIADEGSFPVTTAPTETSIASFGTSNSVNLPTVISGDALIMLLTADQQGSGSTWNTPSGWTALYTAAGNPLTAAFIKVATGSEGSTQTVTVTGSGIAGAAAQVYRVQNWYGALSGINAANLVEATTGSPDPPSLTAPWGPLTNLWIAVVHAADDDETVSSYSTGFIGGTDTISGGGANAGATMASARQENSSETVDPGVFVLSGTDSTRSIVIVIRPVPAGATVVPQAIHIFRQQSLAPANDNRPPLALVANQ